MISGEAELTRAGAAVTGRLGLSGRLIVLTVLFVLMAELLIFIPFVASYRRNWLENHVAAAYTAALVLEAAPNGMVSDMLASQLLDSIGAHSVALKMKNSRRLLASGNAPSEIDATTDMRDLGPLDMTREAVATLIATRPRTLRVLSAAPMGGDFIEIVIDETPLRQAVLRFTQNLALISLIISVITAILLYGALNLIIVQPMRRLTRSMTWFGADPEDRSRVIRPSARPDEIGLAERELAMMQAQLADLLHQKSHLAALGLAVAKISHDLRNLLAAAQLMSDRLVASTDPRVRSFAPRLMDTLGRAIDFCQATLTYGRAAEAPPQRQIIAVAPLIAETRELVGLAGDSRLDWQETLPEGLEVDADPGHLQRVLLNLTRNSVQTLDNAAAAGAGRGVLRFEGRREGEATVLDIIDNGPGVPEKARKHLFEAFSGSARPGGTGLGLAIASELVRAHGGALALIDTAQGAHFRITLPDREKTAR